MKSGIKTLAIEVQQVEFKYDSMMPSVLIIEELTVGNGEFVSVVGRSGCGKTTLLRILAGLLVPQVGKTQVLGGDPKETRIRTQLGVVYQDPSLVPWLSVTGNLALPLRLRGEDLHDGTAERLLSAVGLADVSAKYPDELSGGMRTRVAMCRALVNEPRLLLLDEPFGSLDEPTRHTVGSQLRSLQQSRKMTAVMVTHNISEAIAISDRIVVLRRPLEGQTSIAMQIGPFGGAQLADDSRKRIVETVVQAIAEDLEHRH